MKCFICGKMGCWTRNYLKEEQEALHRRYKSTYYARATMVDFAYFLIDYEGYLDVEDYDMSNGEEEEEDVLEGNSQRTHALLIEVKEVPIEAYHSIGKVERYYATLRRVYDIIRAETGAEPDTVKKAMEAALATRNGLDIICVWRERAGWQGPFILLANDGTTCTIEPTADTPANEPANGQSEEQLEEPQEEAYKAIVIPEQPARRRLGRLRKHPPKAFVSEIAPEVPINADVFATAKEDADYALAVELWEKGIIKTLEIKALIDRGVFYIVMFDERKYGGIWIFKSRLVREVKGKNEVPYEKSRLICHLYLLNAIMVVEKPLYGILEAGTHWWATYNTLTFDLCLLVSLANNRNFGLIGMQTDDTIGLIDKSFLSNEDKELKRPADLDLTAAKQQYVEQRARGAYIPGKDEIKALNKRIVWQMANLDRGLRFAPLDLATAKLFVFVDGLFANNNDLTSQLGFIVVLANEQGNSEEDTTDGFTLTANVVHYSSTKCKRVTRSVLASEIYAMVAGADIAYAIGTTITMITNRLKMPPIPTILCTDLYSLYECLVKLGTIKEKRLMIDIMALRQSYERREIYEIRWI
ncbi:hypothetical protein LX36DRAFT_664046 [Colletotrichum falcatum]|nr:hypothetical protein LX36DRAFT_664046 [Colletotrichum falcatum]